MCGIVGIAGNLFSREEMTMKRLLLLDSLRGMDSTGMAAVRMGGKYVVTSKKASHCFNLFDAKSFCDALNGISSLAFIGHNRSATVGGIKDVNAHPFQIDHITGVHNGTLEDSDKRLLEDIVGEKFNTDSEALFAAIAKIGVKEVIPKITKGKDMAKGAWSLVWWDTTDMTLNFLRNEHRPMWYCYSDDFKQIFWASEFWMLDAALQKSGNYSLFKKQSTKDPEKSFRFFQTDPDVLYSVNVEKLAKGGKDRPKLSVTKLAGKEPVAAAPGAPFVFRGTSQQHGSGCGNGTTSGTHTPLSKRNTKTTTTLKNTLSAKDGGSITLYGDLQRPYAGYYNRQGFHFLGTAYSGRSNGPECSWCHETVPYGQPGLTIYSRDNVILCAKCSGHNPTEFTLTSDFAPATRIYVPKLEFQKFL
jgi:predicted glutamine amidotransferase